MTFNTDAVGFFAPAIDVTWDSKDCLLYALGIGYGNPDPLADLEFTTENSEGVEQVVVPSFPVVLPAGTDGLAEALGPIDWTMLVHGEQEVRLHRPLPVEGHVRAATGVGGIYDKGSGALLCFETIGADAATGETIYELRSGAFVRGAGGWGGDRGPARVRVVPDRDPDRMDRFETRADQALLYRLSGDRNPLHSDPTFATRAGFERPILHGLCTFGIATRSLIDELCPGAPHRVRSIGGRFSAPVIPGTTLVTSMWRTDSGAVFRVATADGTIVLDDGQIEVS